MPGKLKQDAKCPECRRPLCALVDTTNAEGVTREFFHEKKSGERRKRRCRIHIPHLAAANRQRRSLEV